MRNRFRKHFGIKGCFILDYVNVHRGVSEFTLHYATIITKVSLQKVNNGELLFLYN
jgi:hypothetical protein